MAYLIALFIIVLGLLVFLRGVKAIGFVWQAMKILFVVCLFPVSVWLAVKFVGWYNIQPATHGCPISPLLMVVATTLFYLALLVSFLRGKKKEAEIAVPASEVHVFTVEEAVEAMRNMKPYKGGD